VLFWRVIKIKPPLKKNHTRAKGKLHQEEEEDNKEALAYM
jgi:hypothetical protein